jgi:hypothetical protein
MLLTDGMGFLEIYIARQIQNKLMTHSAKLSKIGNYENTRNKIT